MAENSTTTVMHLLPSFQTGGSETQALRLIGGLQSVGTYRIMLATLDGSGPLRQTAENAGFSDIPEYKLQSFYHPTTLAQLRRFVSFLRTNHVTVLQTHDFYSNIFGMTGGVLAAVPVRIGARRESTGLRSTIKRRLERVAYRAATCIVANCEAVRQQLILEGVPAEKVHTVYNSLNDHTVDSAFRSTREEICASLRILGGATRQLVTTVGNFRLPVKDQPTFLRAAQLVAAKCPEVTFVLAGEGPLLEAMRSLVEELGIGDRTHFTGRCDRVSGLLRISDVAVLTSRSEGFPNSVLEYMAAGAPVVTTDVGGVREIVADGEMGYVVAPGDSAAVADRIVWLLQHPQRARLMGKLGREVVRRRFTVQEQVNRTLSIYEQLLSRRGLPLPRAAVVQPCR